MVILTAAQVRQARALLGWTSLRLAGTEVITMYALEALIRPHLGVIS